MDISSQSLHTVSYRTTSDGCWWSVSCWVTSESQTSWNMLTINLTLPWNNLSTSSHKTGTSPNCDLYIINAITHKANEEKHTLVDFNLVQIFYSDVHHLKQHKHSYTSLYYDNSDHRMNIIMTTFITHLIFEYIQYRVAHLNWYK